MAPSWVAIDKRGRPLTPVVTHQDRRSAEEAYEIERRVGKPRHLKLAGNRPIPGGISSTTWMWHLRRSPAMCRRFHLVGHLNTMLAYVLTGCRATDPSNASFMGVYSTCTLKGWNDELIDAVGIDPVQLPEVYESNAVVGHVTDSVALGFGLRPGTPVLAGIMDGSCAMLVAGAKHGQLVNVSGSTDVLAACIDRPKPHPDLLTRALGVGRAWLAVSTLAAAGSALDWAHRTLYPEMSREQFWRHLIDVRPGRAPPVFVPDFAGSRTSVDPLSAAIFYITLSTTRDDLLASLVESLVQTSADRLALFDSLGLKLRPEVLVAGGVSERFGDLLHRRWPTRFRFKSEPEATLRGIARLAESR
jgi:sugar (pentulose or hexulose) kinase